MRIPYAFQGLIAFPIIVTICFFLSIDSLATPIFLPLVAVYKIFGGIPASTGQELLFILLYWGALGFLLGFILDMYAKKADSHAVTLPTHVSTHPSLPAPTPISAPIYTYTPSISPVSPVYPSVKAAIPSIVPNPVAAKKPPINLLDRKEEDLPQATPF